MFSAIAVFLLESSANGVGELGALCRAAQVARFGAGSDGFETGRLDSVGNVHVFQVAQHHHRRKQKRRRIRLVLALNVRRRTVHLKRHLKSIYLDEILDQKPTKFGPEMAQYLVVLDYTACLL